MVYHICFFFTLNYALGTRIRNDNKPNIAMIGQIVGAILNMVLDYVFMGPLKMGIAGATIAIGLEPVVGILIVVPHFIRKKEMYILKNFDSNMPKSKKFLLAAYRHFQLSFLLD